MGDEVRKKRSANICISMEIGKIRSSGRNNYENVAINKNEGRYI